MSSLNVDVAPVFVPLLEPARYKGAYGGRAGAKSHFFAEHLVVRCVTRETRAVCIREVQNSLKESVRQLLVDKIDKLGLHRFFRIKESEIEVHNGGLITFRGMQNHTAESIKSLEGYDIAWIEEAQSLSAKSWRLLRPTIRKEGSEIWCTWNPRHDTDAVDAFFRGPHKPADAIAVQVSWHDNPWLPTAILAEIEADYAADAEMAEHVWGGGYEIVSEGSYYSRLLAAAEAEGRVGHFPHDPALPVITSWDIGVRDHSAVWFWQEDGFTATVIDYYEVSGDGAEEIVRTALPEHLGDEALRQAQLEQLGREHPFKYGRHYLPHDVKVREWGAGARQRIDILRGLGLERISKGAAANPADRIAAVRKLLPNVRFNNTVRVAKGIARLRRFSRKWNEGMQMFVEPLHDINSHAADAFGEFAVNVQIEPPKPAKRIEPTHTVLVAQDNGVIVSNTSVLDFVKRKQRERRLNG